MRETKRETDIVLSHHDNAMRVEAYGDVCGGVSEWL